MVCPQGDHKKKKQDENIYGLRITQGDHKQTAVYTHYYNGDGSKTANIDIQAMLVQLTLTFF